jgi:hypothetical protein
MLVAEPSQAPLEESVGRRPSPRSNKCGRLSRPCFFNRSEEANAAQQAEIAIAINVQVAVDVSGCEFFPFR